MWSTMRPTLSRHEQATFGQFSQLQRQRTKTKRHVSVVVRADDGFCRDKINLGTPAQVLVDGTATIVFLGAKGQAVEVQCPKVRFTGAAAAVPLF
jgi:hypothetical protein